MMVMIMVVMVTMVVIRDDNGHGDDNGHDDDGRGGDGISGCANRVMLLLLCAITNDRRLDGR